MCLAEFKGFAQLCLCRRVRIRNFVFPALVTAFSARALLGFGLFKLCRVLVRKVPNVCLHSRSFSLPADWRRSDSSVDGKPQGYWRWYSNSRDVVASCPSFSRPTARSTRKACSQANVKYQLIPYLNSITSELSNLLSPRNALFTFKEE